MGADKIISFKTLAPIYRYSAAKNFETLYVVRDLV
jgi:hypothetical protein